MAKMGYFIFRTKTLQQITEGTVIDLGDVYERADAIGKKAAKKAYDSAYRDALERLQRSKPIIDALQDNEVRVFIDKNPGEQTGIYIVIEDPKSVFIKYIERVAGDYLDEGTILFPSGFDKYAERMEMITRCKEILTMHEITSKIITKAEDGLIVLYVPPSMS